MSIFNYLIKISCNAIYFFLKIKKIKNNKVIFISRMSNNKPLDFELIEKELKKQNKNIECVFLCKRITSFTNGLFSNIIYTLKCLSNLANAKVCITDTYSIAVSVVKHKKQLTIIQIWHSMSAIKKFGYQTLGNESGRDAKVSKILNMHKNYDFIISGSKEMSKYFAEAFNYNIDTFVNCGLPRMDYLLKNKDTLKKKIFKDYPELKNKINILYAPTFRTTGDDQTEELIKVFDLNKYNLIIKAHERQNLKSSGKVLSCEKYCAMELLPIIDYLITDYSAIAVEAAILDIKTIYYVYDYEKYKKNNGLNIDLYKEMKGCVFNNSKELYKFIETKKYDMSILEKYKNKYIDVQDGTSTAKIVALILGSIEND